MEIIGERRPVANRKYKYSFKIGVDKYAPARWKIFDINDKDFKKVLYENTNGLFCFQSTDIGKEFILKAYVEIYNTQEVYKTKLAILSDQMKILSVEWRDVNNKPINGRTVGYLDDIKLVIKTLYIPMGDTLSVTIYEDEAIGSPRCMGTYKTTPINKEGYTELHLKKEMLKLYQQRLNNADPFDESEHEYYVQIVYRDHINRVEKGIQLKIKNVLDAFIKPKVAVKPVVVNVPNPPKKNDKKKIDIIFNVFFDGTGNNKSNTESRIRKKNIYYQESNKKNDSYTNFFSNIALFFMNLKDVKNNYIINIYTEGIGTNDNEEDKTLLGQGLGASIFGSEGIEKKVDKTIAKMQSIIKERSLENKINTAIINVLGFSRGAAAARNFISQRKEIASKLKLENEYKIYFNFVGLFDTVASYGVYHQNDVKELSLDIKGNAKKVIHLVAADEYRENFKLTNIESSIKAGVGYELSLPGAHSDIGGGYRNHLDSDDRLENEEDFCEKRKIDTTSDNKKIDKIKNFYKKEGWYKEDDFKIENGSLYGARKLTNLYQYIPLKIMIELCKKYSKTIIFDEEKFKKRSYVKPLDVFLSNLQEEMLKFALENDGINSISFKISDITKLHELRHSYLHLSDSPDDNFVNQANYEKEDGSFKKRDVLKG